MLKKVYYLISGLSEGESITPYIINNKDNELGEHLQLQGDESRSYKPLSFEEVIQLTRQGVEHQ